MDIIDIRCDSVDQHHRQRDFNFNDVVIQVFIRFNDLNRGFAASSPHANAEVYVMCN
jgi:hypothetical protein